MCMIENPCQSNWHSLNKGSDTQRSTIRHESITYYNRFIDTPVPEGQPEVVQPHDGLGYPQTNETVRRELIRSEKDPINN